MAAFCPSCHKLIPQDAERCPYCDAATSEDSASPKTDPTPVSNSPTEGEWPAPEPPDEKSKKALATSDEGANPTLYLVAFVISIVSIVAVSLYSIAMLFAIATMVSELGFDATVAIGLLPAATLIWGIPITIRCYQAWKAKVPMSMALAIVTLILWNVISGILLVIACATDRR